MWDVWWCMLARGGGGALGMGMDGWWCRGWGALMIGMGGVVSNLL